ncbi:MAG: DNA recombination protein RmuC [Pseudomonadota bacterium]|nr:DNA recombination protein RmuC [Pseudomonadota bacterium]
MEIIAIALLILLPIVLFTTFISFNHNRAVRMDLNKQLRELEFKNSELRTQSQKLEEEKQTLQANDRKLTIETTELRKEKEFTLKENSLLKEQLEAHAILDTQRLEQMKLAFKDLSSASLQTQAENYRQAAKATFSEREEAIAKLFNNLQEKVGHLESLENRNSSDFKSQMDLLRTESKRLGEETNKLANAFKNPSSSGKWGEVQLQRILELAGLKEGIDYTTQQHSTTEDGKSQRPDIVVKLPGKREIIIDSKVPMTALLGNADATDAQLQDEALKLHLRALKNHVEQLANKEYWRSREQSLDFVIMALPEFAYLPAIKADREVIDWAMNRKIIIATPHILLALLRSVANLHSQANLVANAKEIREHGKELLERMIIFSEAFRDSGNSLRQAVEKYNKAVGSWDKRLAPSMRKFVDLGVPSDKAVPEISTLAANTRTVQQLTAADDEEVAPQERPQEQTLEFDDELDLPNTDDVVTQLDDTPLAPLPLQKAAEDD